MVCRERKALRRAGRRVAALRRLSLRAMAIGLMAGTTPHVVAQPVLATVPVSTLPKRAEVDLRYQSYNIEMVEVTGGRFWAPYGGPAGERYRDRPPMDLANPKLRALAKHLSPVYLRVSGTWANSTYVPLKGERIDKVPKGFGQILQRQQWKNLIGFAKAVGAPIVTSFAASPGTRDAQGRWTSEQADRFMALTRQSGGRIHAAEFINEPSLVGPGQLPKDYDSSGFAQDFSRFATWAKRVAPDMLLLGPGNLGEATVDPQVAAMLMAPGDVMSSERLLERTARQIDAVSWHFYGGVSPRCGGGSGLTSASAALSDAWLDRTLTEYASIAESRDKLAPGKPLWLTETAQAACGGSPWAAGFRDTFRYLNQLGALAQHGVRTVMHNTLAASEYGLLDPETLNPRPNYWAAVLWRRTMGKIVLDVAPPKAFALRLYAHCAPAMNGNVSVLALNPGDMPETLNLGGNGKRWIMTADDLDRGPARVNGEIPTASTGRKLSGLDGVAFVQTIGLPARSIAFATSLAKNAACKALK